MNPSSRAFVLAAAGLVAASALFVSILTGALTVEPVAPIAPAAEPPATNSQQDTPAAVPGRKAADERFASSASLSPEAIALMVNQDPFSPTREAAEPYRLPGEEVAAAAPEPVREPPPPQFRVHGTVVTPSGGYALLEHENSQRIVSIGESVLGYRLAGVDARSATLESNGRLITYSIEDPPMRRPTRNTPAPARNSREAQADRAREQRQQQLRQDLLQRALQQLRELGDDAPDELRERLMEMVRGAGAAGFSELRVNPGTQIRILHADSVRRESGGH